MKKYIAEFIGTFALVFCGTGAIIVNEQSNGSLGFITIGLLAYGNNILYLSDYKITRYEDSRIFQAVPR